MLGKLKGLNKFLKLGIVSIRHLVPACVNAMLSKDAKVNLIAWKDSCCKVLCTSIFVDDRRTIKDGEGDNKGRLYVHLNQQTLLSVLLYTAAVPGMKLIVNFEFALLPLIGWLQVLLGGTVIIRQFPAHAKSKLEAVVQELKNGDDIGISIEGRRSLDGKLSPYKKGAVVMAIEAECDIVPFRTCGEYDVWPLDSIFFNELPSTSSLTGKDSALSVILYPAISMKGATYADRHRVLKTLRSLGESEECANCTTRVCKPNSMQ